MSTYKKSYESHKQNFLNIAKEYGNDRTSKTFYRRVLKNGKNENSDESSEKDWKDIQNKFIQVYDKWKLHFEFDTSELKVNDHRMLTEEGCWKDGKYPKNSTEIYLFKSSVYGIFEALFKWINYFEDRFFINRQHHSLELNATSIFSRLCEYINRDYESIKKFIYSDFFYDKNANEIMKYNFEHGGKYVKGILQLLQIIDDFLYISDDQIDEELKNKISKIEKRFFEEHNLYHGTAVSMASRKNILERGRLHIGNSTSIKDIELIQKKFKEVNDIWKMRCCDEFVGPKTEEKYSWKNKISPSSIIINKLRFNFYTIFDQLFNWMIIPESDFMLNDYLSFDRNTYTNMGLIQKYILTYNNPRTIEEDNCYQNIEKRIQENKKLELDTEHLAIIKYNINNGSCCRDNILQALDRIYETLVEYVEKPNLEKDVEETRIEKREKIEDIKLIQKKFVEVHDYYILKCYGGNPSGISIFNEKASWKEYLLPTDFMLHILRTNFHLIFDQLFKWMNIPEIEEFILKDYFSLNSHAFHTSTFVNIRLIGKFIMGYKNPLKVENDWYQAVKNFIKTNEGTEEYLNTIKHNMNNGSCYKDNILIALDRIHEIFIEYYKYYNDIKRKTISRFKTRDNFFEKLNDEQKQERHKQYIAQLSEKAHNPSEFQDSVLNFNDESNLKNLQERFFDEGYKLILGGSYVISNSSQLKKIGGFIIGNPVVVFPSKEKGDIKMDHFSIWTFLPFIDKNSTRKASEIFGESPLSPMEEYEKFLKL